MIWCVTLNPALDVTYQLSGTLRVGQVNIAASMDAQLGGKGNNVARVVRQWGASVTAVAILGGVVGQELAQRARDMEIPVLSRVVEEDSRICLTLVGDGQSITELRPPGPPVPPDEAHRLLQELLSQVQLNDWVTLSGSLPLGLEADTYGQWVRRLKGRVAGVIVDTSGRALESAVREAPSAIVPNRDEHQALAAYPALAATEVIVTEGEDGVHWYTSSGEVRQWPAPKVSVVNPVGAGDTFLGALVVQLAQGAKYSRAIPWAMATASASVETLGVAVFYPERVRELLSEIEEGSST